ncbi:MAG: hypothetical protein ACRBN8_04610 [Nannocystales bacterium]
MIEKITLFTLLSLSVSPSASDPLASLPTDRIDLELKDAPIADVMLLVGDIIQSEVVLDPCVSGTLSLKLESITIRTFLEVAADTLSLTYDRTDGGELHVGCEDAPGAGTRVDMAVVQAPLPEALAVLAEAGGTSVASESCDDVVVDLRVSNAPVSAVVSAIAAQADASVERTPDGLRLRC